MAFGDFTVTRASTKNVLGSAGLYVSVANNVPAFEFNTDGSYRGLLVEPGATNLFTRSQEFNDAAWVKVASTITANAAVAPDGTTTADKLVETAVDSIHYAEQNKTLTAAVHSISFYMKAGERTWGGIRGVNSVSGNCLAWFNLATGAKGSVSGTGATSSIENVGSGWYRCTLTIALASASPFEYRVFVATGDTVTNYLGDGTSGIFIWQAQLETGVVATSYIVTAAGTANRATDVVTLTGASSLIGQTQGTIAVRVNIRDLSSGNRRIFVLDNGAEAQSIYLRVGTANQIQLVVFNTGAQAVISGANNQSGTLGIVARYGLDDFSLHVNGATIGTDTSGTVPVTSIMRIGSSDIPATASHYLNDRISAVAVLPNKITTAEANALSLSLSTL